MSDSHPKVKPLLQRFRQHWRLALGVLLVTGFVAVNAVLAGPKALQLFPGLGHQSYVEAKPEDWRAGVRQLLDALPRER